MSANDATGGSSSAASRRARRLRIIAVIVLSLGIAGAGVVYGLGTRSGDQADDLAMLGYNRPAERQLAVLYGSQGRLIEDLANALKQPGTQALIILTVAVIVAASCFHFARLLDYDAEHADETKFPGG